MPVYHCSIKSVSRAVGRSATAAAAYRAAEIVRDTRTGEVFDFTRKGGVLHSEIVLPDGGQVDRETLWNAVEMAEKRKDAKVAREFVVALPHELSHEQQKELIRDYAQGLSQRTGWAVDVAVHEPGRQGDLRNVHAHLLCTTRTVELDANGQLVMGKKTREWDVASTSKALVSAEREYWAQAVNQALERGGFEQRVDHRSYEEQGNGLLPTVHLGVHASAMERQGRVTERGDHNRAVKAHNAQVIELAEKRREREEAQAWKSKLVELEQMPASELSRVVDNLNPGTVQDVLRKHPKVQDANRPLAFNPYDAQSREAYDKGEIGWLSEQKRHDLEKDVREAGIVERHAQREENEWRKQHPVLAKLHENPMLPYRNADLTGLEKQVSLKRQEREAVVKVLDDFKQARAEVEQQVQAHQEELKPWAEKEHARQMTRYQEAKALLEKRKALEQEQDKTQERGRER